MKYFIEIKVIKLSNEAASKNPTMETQDVLKLLMTLNMLNGIIMPLFSKKTEKQLSEEEFEKMILHSIIWAVSGIYEQRERQLFLELLGKHKVPLPKCNENETVYDFII